MPDATQSSAAILAYGWERNSDKGGKTKTELVKKKKKKSLQWDSFKKPQRKINIPPLHLAILLSGASFGLAATRDGSNDAIFNAGRNRLFHELVSEREQAGLLPPPAGQPKKTESVHCNKRRRLGLLGNSDVRERFQVWFIRRVQSYK